MTPAGLKCEHCAKRCMDENALWQHHRRKHRDLVMPPLAKIHRKRMLARKTIIRKEQA